jgi:hypothetical protein
LFFLLAVPAWLLTIAIGYFRATRWAGGMNAESFGYMMGSCLTAGLLSLLVVFLVNRSRQEKLDGARKHLALAWLACGLSLFFLAISGGEARSVTDSRQMLRLGQLMKEAAGTQPASKNREWYDGPCRDFFHDLLDRNEQYAAEVSALDSSAVKDLYSAASYTSKGHMEKVLEQLRATVAVEEKYASIEPIMKTMEARIDATEASMRQKADFLKGLRSSYDLSIKPHTDLVRMEKTWIDTTIDLYEFTTEHSAAYSVRSGKLYFKDAEIRGEFLSRQSKAIALHEDFLKAKAALQDSRKNKLNELGLSTSDFTPSQLGKTK